MFLPPLLEQFNKLKNAIEIGQQGITDYNATRLPYFVDGSETLCQLAVRNLSEISSIMLSTLKDEIAILKAEILALSQAQLTNYHLKIAYNLNKKERRRSLTTAIMSHRIATSTFRRLTSAALRIISLKPQKPALYAWWPS